MHEINFQGSRMKDAKDGGGVALFLIQHDIAHKMQSGRGRFTVQCDFNGSNGMAVAKRLTSQWVFFPFYMHFIIIIITIIKVFVVCLSLFSSF